MCYTYVHRSLPVLRYCTRTRTVRLAVGVRSWKRAKADGGIRKGIFSVLDVRVCIFSYHWYSICGSTASTDAVHRYIGFWAFFDGLIIV